MTKSVHESNRVPEPQVAPVSSPGGAVPPQAGPEVPPPQKDREGSQERPPLAVPLPETAVARSTLRRMVGLTAGRPPAGAAVSPARPLAGDGAARESAIPAPVRPVLKAEARPGGPPAGTAPAPSKLSAVRPVAAEAAMQLRHRGILASFAALVVLPVFLTASYLWLVAVDQYASTVGFSVRTEEVSSSLGILGGLTRLSGSSSDADILYDYIHSQELVEFLDDEIDLKAIFSKAWPNDPIFAFNPDGSIEDLVDHWEDKVKITYDTSSGLMTLRVLAFTAEDATLIATKILERSTEKVNLLSQDAREDATRYTRTEMERALERLKEAREALTKFRMQSRVVDPVADLQGQMGVLNSLQAQLAESYVELDLLRATATETDPRITQTEQRIIVIQRRIAEERQKFGENGQGPGGEDYATMVAEFERLSVDREYAEQTYHTALAAYDVAQAEAQRKSRYLAAHIMPTVAQKAEYPARWTLLGLTAFFLLMAWSIGVLIYYSIRDRR